MGENEESEKVEEKKMRVSDCSDEKCPIHAKFPVRGRTFEGEIISAKMQKTVKVRWPRQFYIPKYERHEKRRTAVMAHVPECVKVSEGDRVRIGECRPISKTVHFVVLEKLQ